MSEPPKDWSGEIVDKWLESRIAASRANQVAAERKGRGSEDDCDIAAAEELVCRALKRPAIIADQTAFLAALKALAERDDYIARGVYNDARFDRHVRAYLRKLIKMAKTNAGFENVSRYQG